MPNRCTWGPTAREQDRSKTHRDRITTVQTWGSGEATEGIEAVEMMHLGSARRRKADEYALALVWTTEESR